MDDAEYGLYVLGSGEADVIREQIAALKRELADARGEAALLRTELANVKAEAVARIDALTHLFCRANAEKRSWREVAQTYLTCWKREAPYPLKPLQRHDDGSEAIARGHYLVSVNTRTASDATREPSGLTPLSAEE
jgi:hypothetical protein